MSTTLQEGELQVSLPESARGRKFDDPKTHRLSHCMKAVDWIIELPDKVYVVELKDLDARGASGRKEARKYLEELEAERKDGEGVEPALRGLSDGAHVLSRQAADRLSD